MIAVPGAGAHAVVPEQCLVAHEVWISCKEVAQAEQGIDQLLLRRHQTRLFRKVRTQNVIAIVRVKGVDLPVAPQFQSPCRCPFEDQPRDAGTVLEQHEKQAIIPAALHRHRIRCAKCLHDLQPLAVSLDFIEPAFEPYNRLSAQVPQLVRGSHGAPDGS